MDWDNLFAGLESLWDSEDDNAANDERRELVRADRATHSFLQVLVQRSITHVVCVFTSWLAEPVHVIRIGASWIDGNQCGSSSRVVVPVGAIVRVDFAPSCQCQLAPVRNYPHVTFGALMRDCERHTRSVRAVLPRSGVNGRVTAVWQDAIDISCGTSVATLPNSAIDHIVIDGP